MKRLINNIKINISSFQMENVINNLNWRVTFQEALDGQEFQDHYKHHQSGGFIKIKETF